MLWNVPGASQTSQTAPPPENSAGVAPSPRVNMTPGGGASPAWDGSFWDAGRMKAAVAAQRPGADGRTVLNDQGWLSSLNSLSGLSEVSPYNAGGETKWFGGDSGNSYVTPEQQAVFKDKFGRSYRGAGKDESGNQFVQYFENGGGGFEDPTGHNDRVQPTYRLDAQGNAVPVSAGRRYDASEWVKNGRDVATVAATMVAAYFGGSWLAAYQAGAVPAATAVAEGGVSASQIAAAGGGADAATGAAWGSGAGLGGDTLGAVGYTGADAATSAAWGSGAGLGGDTLGAVGGSGAAGSSAGAGAGGLAGSAGSSGGSMIGNLAKSAGQSVVDFVKTPAGQKALLALGGAAFAKSNAGTPPTPGMNGAGGGGGGGSAGDISGQQFTLAQQQAARNAQLQGQSDPLYAQLIQNNVAQAGKNATLSDAQYSGYTNNFAPLESKMADTALNFDTPGRREQEAQTAVADQATRFTQARDDRNRSLMASGIDPSSGKAQAYDNSARIEQAKAEAGGANAARRQVESTGLSLIQNAANFGQTKLNTGMGLSNAATNTGNAAAALSNQQQNTSNNNAQTTSGLFSNASNTLGTQANINNGLFNQQQTAYNNKNAQTSDWLGAIGQVAGAYFSSSKKLKDEVGDVNTEAAAVAVGSTPIKAWRYKPGAVPGDDGSVKIGKYAEDSQGATGLGDGKGLDAVTENGLNQATLQYLLEKEAKRDPKLRKKLAAAAAMKNTGGGLADARRRA